MANLSDFVNELRRGARDDEDEGGYVAPKPVTAPPPKGVKDDRWTVADSIITTVMFGPLGLAFAAYKAIKQGSAPAAVPAAPKSVAPPAAHLHDYDDEVYTSQQYYRDNPDVPPYDD